MKYNKYILSLLMGLSSFFGQGQNWQAVDSLSFDPNPKFMYVDTLQDRLYLGGEFYNNNGRVISQLFYYDGKNTHNIDTLQPIPSGTTNSMARYKGELYVGGNFYRMGKNNAVSYSFIKMKNDTFISIPKPPEDKSSSTIHSMVEYGGKLILGYDGDSLAGIKSRGIMAYDGQQFESLGGGVLNYDSHPFVYALAVFKNKLYAGGNFNERTSAGKTEYTSRNFQVWDNKNQVWAIVDGWKGGHNSAVGKLLVFQEDLYIMGGWNANDNAIGNDVVRFDGKFFYSTGKGSGLYGIWKAAVFNDELYVCGAFREMDGIQAYGIAKWNGVRWCNLSNDVFTRFGGSNIDAVADIAFYHDTLFAFGSYDEISGKTIQTLAKWIGDSSMTGTCASPAAKQDTVNYNLSVLQESKSNLNFKIFPNPTKGVINIETDEFVGKKQVQLVDQSGKVLIWGSINSNQSEMDLKGLESGIYFLQIEEMGVQKILKY